MYGQCNSTYLVLGNYCNLSCGRCGVDLDAMAEVAAVEMAPAEVGAPAVEAVAVASAPGPVAEGGQPAVEAASGPTGGGRRRLAGAGAA